MFDFSLAVFRLDEPTSLPSGTKNEKNNNNNNITTYSDPSINSVPQTRVVGHIIWGTVWTVDELFTR